MTTFLESQRFPDDIAYGSRGGPMYNTSVFTGSNGMEKRNINWAYPRHQYNVGYGARSHDKLYDLVAFFHTVRGSGIGFRFKDFGDYKSCKVTNTITEVDQPMALIDDGTDTKFQLIKQYQIGTLTQNRLIQKPVEGTILVSESGIVRTEGVDYTIDYTTGIVTFAAPEPVPAALRWGGEFDVPCRFEEDTLPISYEDFQHGSIDVSILEVMIDADLMELPGEGGTVSDYPLSKVVLGTGEALLIPADFQYLVYRSFTVETGAELQLEGNGELVVIAEDDI